MLAPVKPSRVLRRLKFREQGGVRSESHGGLGGREATCRTTPRDTRPCKTRTRPLAPVMNRLIHNPGVIRQ